MTALDKALNDYHNTDKTISVILKETGLSKSYFYRHLDYKEESRAKKKARTYTFNLEKFKKDSKEKYYWLGFIAADGCVRNNSLIIELKDIDTEHLQKFNTFFENTKELEFRENSLKVKCVKAIINSYQLLDVLSEYNIVPNKSTIYTIPIDKIPQKYMFHFLRGLIDGDGCIRFNNHQQISLSFCSGNKECVEQVLQILNLNNKISQDKNTYCFSVTGNVKAKTALDKIYQDSNDSIRLSRKYNIYKKTLS